MFDSAAEAGHHGRGRNGRGQTGAGTRFAVEKKVWGKSTSIFQHTCSNTHLYAHDYFIIVLVFLHTLFSMVNLTLCMWQEAYASAHISAH